MKWPIAAVLILATLQGCASSPEKQIQALRAAEGQGDTLSVGKVQRSIEVGMSSSDVVSILGSPNMVTTDDQRRESWVYDKVSTESMKTTSNGFSFFFLLGHENRNTAASSSQKTLTIVIKFDNEGKVRDYAYHQTRF